MPITFTDNSIGKAGLEIPDRYTDELWTPWSNNAYMVNRMLAGFLAIAQGDANYTLKDTSSDRETRTLALKFTTTLTANREIKIDLAAGKYSGRLFIIWNASGGAFKLTIKTTAGGSTGPDVNQGKIRAVWHDGTNVYPAGPEMDATTFSIAPTSLAAIGARGYHSTTQSISNATATVLSFDSERFDTDTIHDTATNNSRLTCKTPGKYLIIGHFGWAANATGWRAASLRVNGSTYIAVDRRTSIGSSDITYVMVSTVYDLALNDYVEILGEQNSGGSLSTAQAGNYTPEFMMVRMGS